VASNTTFHPDKLSYDSAGNGLGDGFRIDEIVLIRFYERFHELRRDQPHLMPLPAKRGADEMRSSLLALARDGVGSLISANART